MHVDLHWTLGGVDASGIDPWEVLAADTESMQVGGTEVEILSEPARALHVALHAALPGTGSRKTLIDLSRALERLPVATWEAAGGLAERLDGRGGVRGGPRGGCPLEPPLPKRWSSRPSTAWRPPCSPTRRPTRPGRSTGSRTPEGLRAKLRIILPRLFPEPDFMRVWYPVARRGRAGLALAYLRRLAWLVTAAPRALVAWRRARRGTRDSA